jgi:hypothetical protein
VLDVQRNIWIYIYIYKYVYIYMYIYIYVYIYAYSYIGKISRVDLGRIGPGGVLYHFNATESVEEGKGMLRTETGAC